jgi:predicted HTH transcriptional regulator
MDRKERARACYQHACLLYVSNRKMTNQSLRERFKLPENKGEAISRIIYDAVMDGKIKLDDPKNNSRRYAKYIPFWYAFTPPQGRAYNFYIMRLLSKYLN